jgi:predicted alpha/beta-fold hydrolase
MGDLTPRTETQPFRAPPWATGPHLQTILARMLRPDARPACIRERLDTPDGDFIDVDWRVDPTSTAPVVAVFHGLEGSSERRYVGSVCRELESRGVESVSMNFRGCSGEPNRALHFYHSGDTSDAAWLLAEVRRRHPGRRLAAMGFSLGGNVVLKMLGERSDGGAGIVDAAAVMSVPYDLAASATQLEQSVMGRMYAEYFLRSLRSKVEMKRNRLSEVLDMGAVDSSRTVREFDDRVTAPLNGFSDAADYYARCSSKDFLASIRVPTLLLHASDDPFLPATAIPFGGAERNDALRLVVSPRGGHVGFVEGTPRRPRFWGEEEVARFLASALLE